MRHGMHFVVIMLVFSLFVVTAPAGGQASMDRPTYTAGDFWAYDLALLTPIEFPNNTSAQFTLSGNSTVTIEGSEARTIGGETRSVYNASHALRVSAVASLQGTGVPLFNNTTFTFVLSVNETVYLNPDGLESLERWSAFDVGAMVELELGDGKATFPFMVANGTAEFSLNYTADTWDFPLTVGKKGEERFTATGQGFVQFQILNLTTLALGPVTSEPAPIVFNGTSSFEVLGEESVTVPVGTFMTLVVESTPVEMGMPANGSTLTYWSSTVGAPVRYTVTNETGDEVVELALTSYRYQVTESLSILGLDVVVAIPILVGIAAVAIILGIVLGRRRRPAMPPPPPPPGP